MQKTIWIPKELVKIWESVPNKSKWIADLLRRKKKREANANKTT